MKALHLVKTSIGAAWALRQMRELVKLGVDVHVAIPPGGPLIHDYEAAGILIHPIQFDFPISKPWQSPVVFRSFRNLVSDIRPDIIHSHFVGTTLTMRLALGKTHPVPRIFQVPGPLHLEHTFFRKVEILTAGRSDYWVGSCQLTCKRYLQSGILQNRLFLSYYGINVEDFQRRQTGKLRKEKNVDTATQLVGMVAYMYPPKRYLGQTRGIKGHEDFIDAIAICRNSMPNLTGILIGGAWNGALKYEKKIRSYAQKKCGDHVLFLGTRDDVCSLYPDLDVAVHPSHSENVGGAVESLLFAIPTIATNVGGVPDLVKHNETGLLVKKKDPARLAEAIFKALKDPEQLRDMALRGQDLAKKLFDVKETAQQVFGIYQDIYSREKMGIV